MVIVLDAVFVGWSRVAFALIVFSADEAGIDVVGGEGDAADGVEVKIDEVTFDGG